MRVHFHLCFTFLCFHHGPELRATDLQKRSTTFGGSQRNFIGSLFYGCEGFHFSFTFLRHDIRSTGYTSQQKIRPFGFMFLEQILVLSRRSALRFSTSCPLVTIFSYC